jgi:hypothetical protein
MKSRFVLLFILSIYLKGFSQPGYMGMKYSVGYHMELTPFFSRISDINEYSRVKASSSGSRGFTYPNESKVVLVNGHFLQMALVKNRKMSLFLNIGQRNRKVFLQRYVYSTLDPDIPDDGDIAIINPLNLVLKGWERCADFGARFYPKDFIAPIGFYYQVGVGGTMFNYKRKEKSIEFYEHSKNDIKTLDVNAKSYVSARINVGIGFMKPIDGPLYFSTGFDLYFVFDGQEAFNYDNFLPYDAKTMYFYDNLRSNSRYYNLMSIKFGLGMML